MKIKIYQVNGDRDPNRVMFASFDNLQKYQGSDQIDSGIMKSALLQNLTPDKIYESRFIETNYKKTLDIE